jgi:hypothetical protein
MPNFETDCANLKPTRASHWGWGANPSAPPTFTSMAASHCWVQPATVAQGYWYYYLNRNYLAMNWCVWKVISTRGSLVCFEERQGFPDFLPSLKPNPTTLALLRDQTWSHGSYGGAPTAIVCLRRSHRVWDAPFPIQCWTARNPYLCKASKRLLYNYRPDTVYDSCICTPYKISNFSTIC